MHIDWNKIRPAAIFLNYRLRTSVILVTSINGCVS